MQAIYTLAGSFAETSALAAGPWDPNMQHGSAVSALIAWAVERLPSASPMQVARIGVDMLRPIPIRPLEIRTEIVREGRKIQVCLVSLRADGKEVVRGNVLRIRRLLTEVSEDDMRGQQLRLPRPMDCPEELGEVRHSSPFISGLGMRVASGKFGELGAAACWFRVERPLIAGELVSPLMRAAIAADFCNGVGSLLDWRKWTVINADLTMNFFRMPVGEWILLEAETWPGRDGIALGVGQLADEQGYFGRAIQSIVLEPR